jgi:hypothetical protein
MTRIHTLQLRAQHATGKRGPCLCPGPLLPVFPSSRLPDTRHPVIPSSRLPVFPASDYEPVARGPRSAAEVRGPRAPWPAPRAPQPAAHGRGACGASGERL